MPKKLNPKKIASRSIRQQPLLINQALEGRYEIGVIQKILGSKQYMIKLLDGLEKTAVVSNVMALIKVPNPSPGDITILNENLILDIIAKDSDEYTLLKNSGHIISNISNNTSSVESKYCLTINQISEISSQLKEKPIGNHNTFIKEYLNKMSGGKRRNTRKSRKYHKKTRRN